MRIYACWDELPYPKDALPDYWSLNWKDQEAVDEKHLAAIRERIRQEGYTGDLSGEIFRTPAGDGYAQYLFANAPRGSDLREKAFLIHLEYGDAWTSRDVKYIPKGEIMKRIVRGNKLF